MITAKCILKIRDDNNIIKKYKLQDTNGNVREVEPAELKRAIRDGKIQITNLKLTSDNRLIDTHQTDTKISNTEVLINKLKLIGYKNAVQIYTEFGTVCYLMSKGNDDYAVIIPDDIQKVVKSCTGWEAIKNLKGKLKIVGGSGLTDISYMFYGCRADLIDLSSLNTSNVTAMASTFEGCRAQTLILTSFKTQNVQDMSYMFKMCDVQELDLSSFDTRNLTEMSYMFDCCDAKHINLSSFNTSKVQVMHGIFRDCKAEALDLTSFDTRNVISFNNMFARCRAKTINISSFEVRDSADFMRMFKMCDSKIITNNARLLQEYQSGK